MRPAPLLIVAATFLAAAGLSVVAAGVAVRGVESSSEIGVRGALDRQGHDWADVWANGLQVFLAGTAPDEAARFDALAAAGRVVDAARLIDQMEVAPSETLAPPRFSVEILRNDAGISMIGLVPEAADRVALASALGDIAGPGDEVSDLLQTAGYPVPEGWQDAMGFAVAALAVLPRSKVSVETGRVEITAIADSAEEKARLEDRLRDVAPPGLRVMLDIAAPRPVLTPFTLRFQLDETGGRFDACSAQDEEARARILAAARAAGLEGEGRCVVGMGVPSPNWDAAAEASLAALARLGAGTVTMTDADITLVAAEEVEAALFDRVVGELETALPEVFSLQARRILPESEEEKSGPQEFYATLSPEGLVQLRGRVSDETLRTLSDSYARARFGTENVYTATRVVEGLPEDWSLRVLTGLEALGHLSNGVVRVTPDLIDVRGDSMDREASAEISRLFATKLGEGADFALQIGYREPPPPEDLPPAPEECEAALQAIMADGGINFEPGSATVDAASVAVMDAIAEVLRECGELPLEIQGHTDSQGREEMNLALSQQRAQSVLNELHARRVLTSSYVATGYGETRPIADNDTEEGREANRRIEFRLIRKESNAEDGTKDEQAAADAADGTAVAGAEPDTGAEAEAGAESVPEDTIEAEQDAQREAADPPAEDTPAEDRPEETASE